MVLSRFVNMKRSRETESFEPNKRPYFVRPETKRKREAEYGSQKRVRTDESDALQRMLVEAYARIEYLEKELKQAKFLQEYYSRTSTNSTYNHVVTCH